METNKETAANKGQNLITLSHPQMPGQAMLQARDDGAIVFEHLFDVESWNEIDKAMRDSLSKYRN